MPGGGWQTFLTVAPFRFFGVDLSIAPLSLQAEFVSLFGSGTGDAAPRARLDVSMAGDTLRIDGDDLADPAAFLAGFSSPDIPLTRSGANGVRIGDDPEPVFEFDGAACRVRTVGGWQRIVSHMLFLRLVRLRPDLLFFHAASVGIAGRAFLFIGPKGRGKTTTSVALAARGHAFLGDETAVVEPATSLVHPFPRPVGIKAGPCASAVAPAVGSLGLTPGGIARLPIRKLVDAAPAPPLPLGGIVFLQPFEDSPRLERIQAGRDELSQMQPLASSVGGDGAGARVFAMLRLLGSTPCFTLSPAGPDETAIHIERILTPCTSA